MAEINKQGSSFGRFWKRYADGIAAMARQTADVRDDVEPKKWAPELPVELMIDHKTTMGATYRDKITGFEGIAVAKCQYLTGCDQTCLQPAKLKDGKIADSCWFDDMRLQRLMDVGTIKVVSPFGPRPTAPLRGADIDPPSVGSGGALQRRGGGRLI